MITRHQHKSARLIFCMIKSFCMQEEKNVYVIADSEIFSTVGQSMQPI